MAARKTTAARTTGKTCVFVATRKGAFLFRGDAARARWRLEGPWFLGQIVHHVVLDPRDGRTLLAATKTGHLGPTMHRSTDLGRTWKEVPKPPAFAKVDAKGAEGAKGRVVNHTFWLTPCHDDEPGAWYAGTAPQGLFRSDDGGLTWRGLPINDDARYRAWMGTEQDGTPDAPKMHSLLVDPRNAKHLYLGMSGGGFHESKDHGETFEPLIDGMEVVEGFDPKNLACHDPHCVRMCPSNPDRLYQQNHCGIYRIDRPAKKWTRIGRRMPASVGDVGFPMVVHPRRDDTAWVFPMDGRTVWPRTSPDGKPAVYGTRDAGATWRRLDRGLPRAHAWWTVKRQAMTNDTHDPVGLYFGTTSGELWASADEGRSFALIARNLPEIYAVEAAVL